MSLAARSGMVPEGGTTGVAQTTGSGFDEITRFCAALTQLPLISASVQSSANGVFETWLKLTKWRSLVHPPHKSKVRLLQDLRLGQVGWHRVGPARNLTTRRVRQIQVWHPKVPVRQDPPCSAAPLLKRPFGTTEVRFGANLPNLCFESIGGITLESFLTVIETSRARAADRVPDPAI
jgi:hypothetical protein